MCSSDLGEEAFVAHAEKVRRYGAAVVVMAFDEQGQADTAERKFQICRRAYEILVERVGFPPEDIIFDPNIFAVATGIEEHNDYGRAYIEATTRIRQALPFAHVSGGVSNFSFSFRGNDRVREAMHAVFLYHAIKSGMDMGIVNAGALPVYEDIPAELRDAIEDVLFNRRGDATERLLQQYLPGDRVAGIVMAMDAELVARDVLGDLCDDPLDLVGFDPRGVARSTPVNCIDDKATLNTLDGDPDTPAEIDETIESQRRITKACVERVGLLLPHLSTTETAHDLDAIRAALGEERLTYLGFSYGTEIGAVYATLYPDRVRALVLDGAVAPDLGATDLALAQAKGFERAFGSFADRCRTDSRCAATPDARALYEQVRTAVERAPIPVSTSGEIGRAHV